MSRNEQLDGLSVFNENFFIPLNNIDLVYTVEAEGEKITEGNLALAKYKIAPQQSKVISLPDYAAALADARCQGKEVVLNLQYRLAAEEPLLSKGFVVAHQQFVLSKYAFPELNTATNSDKVSAVDHAKYIVFSANGVDVTISKATGLVTYLDVNGKPLFEEGYTLRPDFWRPATDNDFGAETQKKLSAWYNPAMELKSFKQLSNNSAEAVLYIAATDATLTLTYTLSNSGELCIEQDLKVNPDAEHKPLLMRYGMELQLCKDFKHIEFYGKGPNENYIDRNSADNIGLYKQSVEEQYYPYIRPQESGNKTDVRYMELRNDMGIGVRIEGLQPLNISAMPYRSEDLDPGLTKKQMHYSDIEPRREIVLHIDLAQRGLGGDDSWGAQPHDKYRLTAESYSYGYIIRPINK